jgi:hypothetical protein
MLLSEYDILAITIALIGAIALIITSATANARLTRQRDYWRQEAMLWNTESDELREEVVNLRKIIKSTQPILKSTQPSVR